jgi:opacity protein-like surface antigen
MRRSLHPPVLVLALLLSGAPLAAQVRGLPVYNSGVPRGIGLYGDVGFPNDAAGGGHAFGATGRLGLGFVGVTATLAAFNPKGPEGSKTSVGATGNLRVFGGPLVPLSVTLQAGVGYAESDESATTGEDVDEWRIPIGVGFALTIPNPVLAIKPWLAPRIDIIRLSGGGSSNTDTRFGLSGGVEFNLLSGLGLHAAYDYVNGDAGNPGIFAIGAHYIFRVPGL